jgi:putative glutamine amidotransferase
MALNPLIGISAWYIDFPNRPGVRLAKLNSTYIDSVYAAGGTPVILSPTDRVGPMENAADLLARVDGLLLSGGEDHDPAQYGQPPHEKTSRMHALRQPFELALARQADRMGLPVFGICLGAQTLAVVRGGTLHQHVTDRNRGTIHHPNDWKPDPPLHDVRVVPGTRLHAIVGADTLAANSRHHQAVDRPGEHLAVSATSADGMIEAVEDDRPDRWVVAVQWHPEEISDRPEHGALFTAFVRECRRRRDRTV